MEPADIGATLDAVSRSLAVIVSTVGLVVTVSQLSRPSILRRRERWLRETLERETNENRRSTLQPRLDDTTARLVGGMLVPGWRFLSLAAQMLIGPAQILLWATGDTGIASAISSLLFSIVFVASPIRRSIRLAAERSRVTFEYRKGRPVRPPRTGMLNTMEGGTRLELLLGLLLSLSLNALALGVALVFLGVSVLGVAIAAIALVASLVLLTVVGRYVRSRVETYGPWSVADETM